MSKLLILILFHVIYFQIHSIESSSDFEHPPLEIKVFNPKGFTFSIPAVTGISLFAFHGKLNEGFDGLEAGHWSRDITKAKNGRFTFIERSSELKIGDVINFWTYVLHNGLGYRHDNGQFVVKAYENASIDEIYPTTNSMKYEIPLPKIEVSYPKGFQVSIPATSGMAIFAFHGKLNEEFNGLEAGMWSKDILGEENGRFTFKDDEVELKIGDTIYYWLYVIKDGLGYRRDNGVFVVRQYDHFEIDIRLDMENEN
uniref:CSON007308 protein n=1 Tax=Culicoides sonorensis TaxID=179676 RepID=A0A336MY82_CULSO